ncbi:MAG: Uma2 family endonuclease [Anaerolineae bacterium]|nr:Uma2 family endonuclease [Anaerolineae bacterium]
MTVSTVPQVQVAVETVKVETNPRLWPPRQGEWTYEDYARLPNDHWRYEIIKGALRMSPAPLTQHQEISINLVARLHQFVRTHQLGKVYDAPIDVILADLASPVQPDILFIAQERLDIVQEKFIEGAPDLIVEILSPSNWLDDRRDKYEVYEAAGVREYWIVDPDICSVEVFVLHEDHYAQVGRYAAGDVVRAHVVHGFEIAVSDFC